MISHPEVTVELGADTLFEIGNHTFFHPIPGLVGLSAESIAIEIGRTQDVMEMLVGRRAKLMRPPAGDWDSTVLHIADSIGLRTINWDVSSGDASREATAERIANWVLREARPGSIVLFHMNQRGWHTAEALPNIIEGLRARGFRLVSVSELLSTAYTGRNTDEAGVDP